MKLLIIDNHDSFTFNLVQIIEEWGKCQLTIIKPAEVHHFDWSEYQKILISPGPGLPGEYGYFKELFSKVCQKASILGVCLGHQALGEYFGARLIHASEIFHGQFSQTHVLKSGLSEVLYKGVSSPFNAGRYHSWILDPDSIPESLEITAITKDGVIMGFSHKSLPVHGVQYHPESYMTAEGRKIITNWLES